MTKNTSRKWIVNNNNKKVCWYADYVIKWTQFMLPLGSKQGKNIEGWGLS